MTSKFQRISIIDILVLLGAFFLVRDCFSEFANDSGVGWHLMSGKYVLENHEVPKFDPFLYSATPRAWISDQWLGDLILYSLYSYASWPLVYAVLTIIFMAVFAVATARLCYASGVSSLSTFISVLFAFKLAQIHFILRPVLFSFSFFLMIYCLLLNYKKYFSYKVLYIFLPVTFYLWTNIHPSFPLGLILMTLFVLSQALSCKNSEGRQEFYPLVLSLMFCFLVTLTGPYGTSLLKSIFTLTQSTYFMQVQSEWHGISFVTYEGVSLLVASIIVIVALVFSKFSLLTAFELISYIVFAVLSMRSVRILPYFSIVLVVPLARSLDELTKLFKIEKSSALHSFFTSLTRYEYKTTHGLLGLCLLSLYLLFSAIVFQKIYPYDKGFGPQVDKFPYQAIQVILQDIQVEKNNDVAKFPDQKSVVVLSHPNWGGFITFYGNNFEERKRLLPLIDDRNYLLGEDFYKNYFESLKPTESAKNAIKMFKAQYVLLPKSALLASYLKSHSVFPLLFEDGIASLFKVE